MSNKGFYGNSVDEYVRVLGPQCGHISLFWLLRDTSSLEAGNSDF